MEEKSFQLVLAITGLLLTGLGTATFALVGLIYTDLRKTQKEHSKQIAKLEIKDESNSTLIANIELIDKKQNLILKNHHKRIKNLEDVKKETTERVEKIEGILKIE